MLKINSKTEVIVNTPLGQRIEGKEKIGEKTYTWMRYISSKENEIKTGNDNDYTY